uniref:DUF7041 domain-containing protein n=1 Tax=Trichogramma kaykai TaxID=54128 RepID=A0ABD2VXQ8_9HYME
MADSSDVGHSGELSQAPDDSRLQLIQEHFGSSQPGSVGAVDALSSRFPLRELTESIKILTENVREWRSSSDGGTSRRDDSRSGMTDAVRIANSGSAVRSFDPFDPANLPAREQSAPATGSFTNSSTPSVSLLTAKKFSHFPTFWKNTPELWLEEIEEKFNSLGISSDTEKFHYTMTSLGGDVVVELADSIRNLPKDNRYESLKNVLVLHLSSVVDKENERSVVARADEVFYQLQNSGKMIHKIDVGGAVAVDQSCKQDSAFESFASEIKEAIKEMSRSTAQLNKPSARQSRRESSGPYCFYHTKYKEKAMKCPPQANCK